ncbi:hypothetical protein ACN47E_008788 [Coniothyrium glycines]
MDLSATPTRISRVDSRFRPRAPIASPSLHNAQHQWPPQGNPQPRRGRNTMGKNHRLLHRRAAQAATQVVTQVVQVIATVDTNGNLIAQETIAPQASTKPAELPVAFSVPALASAGPLIVSPVASALQIPPAPQAVPSTPSIASVLALALPQVPPVPIVAAPSLPVVPSVPPFPSDLVVPSVPAYPFSSGAAVAQAVATTTAAIPSVAAPSATASTTNLSPVTSSLASVSVSPSGTPGFSPNSSLSPSSQSSILPLSVSQTPTLSSGTISQSSTRSAVSSSVSGASTSYYGGGGNGPGSPGSAPAASPAPAADAGNNDSSAPLETPQVVGSVVGSLAGAALILAIILLLIRRHKRRRGGALQLTGDDHTDRHQPMRQAPARSSIIPSAFLHRFSGMSRSTAETKLSGGERSFQRISGRKLPSAFSEGMTSDQFSQGGTMSGSSFYRDDHGIYGGPGLSKELGKEIGDTHTTRESGHMNFRPSPARTPMIRHPDEAPTFDTDQSYLSPPQSPNPDFPTRGTLGRSLPSADGSRSSRFTENV